MPTLRLIYPTEQQYADMTEDETNTTTTAAAELLTTHSIFHEQSRRLDPIDADDATRNASSNSKEPPAVGGVKMEHQEQSDDHEDDDDDDYVDTLLQEAIDAVNQQVVPAHEEMALSSHEESENDNDSSTSSVHLDTVQEQFQDETVSSDEEEIENCSSCTSSVNLDAIQQTSGNKRKRRAPQQSFDDRLNDLMAFKAKYGHCDVSQRGGDASLGKWCSQVRWSYKKIQSNQKPRKKNNKKPENKLSDEQIQRLIDAGFNWSLVRKVGSAFDERFNDLMAFKSKYGHCDVSQRGENASLGQWCIVLRVSYKKIQNNKKPENKLSDGQIQRLIDTGFNWSLVRKVGSAFDERFNDLMTFKAKYGHCDVSQRGGDASLGKWCSQLRSSYKKMENKKKPHTKLSDEQIQRLNDAGFKWSLQKESSRL
jgi:SOS response regulatory protein OraA/RecX